MAVIGKTRNGKKMNGKAPVVDRRGHVKAVLQTRTTKTAGQIPGMTPTQMFGAKQKYTFGTYHV